MQSQLDMFETPILPGLNYRTDFISLAEEENLIDAINGLPLAPFQFHGWEGKRLTASFGWHYDFNDATFQPTKPIPEFLLEVKTKAARFAGFAPEQFVQALLIRYDPGAGIGWHRDRPVFEHVVGISLGAPTTMRFRRRAATGFARTSVPLAARSVYHLSGEARHQWEHSIAPMDVTRWSITFRSLTETSLRS